MTEQLCDFPTCQLARQKGFNEECGATFRLSENGPDLWRPTQDLLERWLREVHHIVITIKYVVGPGYYYADLGIISRALSQDGVPGAPFHTHELAREAAIVHALKLLPDADTNYKG